MTSPCPISLSTGAAPPPGSLPSVYSLRACPPLPCCQLPLLKPRWQTRLAKEDNIQSQLLGAVLLGHFTPRALCSRGQALSWASELGRGGSSQTWPHEGHLRGHQTEPGTQWPWPGVEGAECEPQKEEEERRALGLGPGPPAKG